MPGYGKTPQALINDATVGKYDIFLGIMCARFGTKTDNANSGTEEEFQIAYDSKVASPENLEVLFYFKDARSSKDEIDYDQLQKVGKFKKSLQSEYAGIHGNFSTTDEFRALITLHLTRILDGYEESIAPVDVVTDKKIAVDNLENGSKISDPLEQLNAVEDDIVEGGIIEAAESLELASNKLVEKLEPVTELVFALNASTRSGTEKLNATNVSGKTQKGAQTKIINSVAGQMEIFVEKSKLVLPQLQLSLEEHIDSFRGFVIIVGEDGLGNEVEKTKLGDAVTVMLDGIKTASVAFAGLQKSASALPRLTSQLNLAKRNVAAISGGISKMLDSAHTQLVTLSEPLLR